MPDQARVLLAHTNRHNCHRAVQDRLQVGGIPIPKTVWELLGLCRYGVYNRRIYSDQGDIAQGNSIPRRISEVVVGLWFGSMGSSSLINKLARTVFGSTQKPRKDNLALKNICYQSYRVSYVAQVQVYCRALAESNYYTSSLQQDRKFYMSSLQQDRIRLTSR